ncbi:hypothetical protein BDY19DRAFT_629489 [Irpex rosettiformis]|uniref:Uncharacterized protein n=1 Tax=Irpex rosettiformis TaxID=378272 RepID=A0ACB8UAZ7_9APHY|nr:hypothetical protein BDY19DRAFT_629489 [Irpex rosettiformis]
MIEDHHARLIHRKKKRSPTSYDWPTASLGDGTTPTPTPVNSSNNTPTPTQNQQTETPTQQTSATPQQQPSNNQPATSNTSSPTPAPATDTSSSTSAPQTTTSATTSSSSPSSLSSSSETTSEAAVTPTQVGTKIPTVTSTNLISPTRHLSSASASASSSASAIADAAKSGSGSSHTGTIVGVVVAVIAGLAAIFFLATYFLRRRARRNEDEFSAEAFKRQSMVLPDDLGHPGPNPPSMLEHHVSQDPVSFGGSPIYGDRSFYGGQSSFGPGEIVAMPPQAWDPSTPSSAQPFYQPMGETPLGSPITPVAYDSFYNAQGQLVRQPSAGAAAMMSHPYAVAPVMQQRQASPGPFTAYNRTPSPGPAVALNSQPSNGPATVLVRQPSPGPVAALNRQPSYGPNDAMSKSPFGPDAVIDDIDHMESPISPPPAAYVTRRAPPTETQYNASPDAHYVDLNRSSVSPYQAAQYEEISSKLRAPPPQPLPTPEVAAFAEKALANDAPVVHAVAQPLPLNVPGTIKSPIQEPMISSDAHVLDDIELPLPSPAYSGKSRVDSTPPTLPEIHLNERSFSPVTMDFPIAPSSVHPSPLSAAFTIPSPSVEAHFPTSPGPANPDTPTAPAMRPTKQEPQGKRPDTVYTLYDDDDAYAGI